MGFVFLDNLLCRWCYRSEFRARFYRQAHCTWLCGLLNCVGESRAHSKTGNSCEVRRRIAATSRNSHIHWTIPRGLLRVRLERVLKNLDRLEYRCEAKIVHRTVVCHVKQFLLYGTVKFPLHSLPKVPYFQRSCGKLLRFVRSISAKNNNGVLDAWNELLEINVGKSTQGKYYFRFLFRLVRASSVGKFVTGIIRRGDV